MMPAVATAAAAAPTLAFLKKSLLFIDRSSLVDNAVMKTALKIEQHKR
jgi:hypothetical protein